MGKKVTSQPISEWESRSGNRTGLAGEGENGHSDPGNRPSRGTADNVAIRGEKPAIPLTNQTAITGAPGQVPERAAEGKPVWRGDLTVRRMKEADIPFAMELKNYAGWNQTERDWQGYLHLEPEGCFVAELDGRPAGTATAIRCGTDVGWIGMLLVHPELRRFGIGSALLMRAVRYLEERGIGSIKLDATPMGRHVYVRFGFCDEYELVRYERTAAARNIETTASETADPMPLPVTEAALEELIAFDSEFFGVNRGAVIKLLAERDPQYAAYIRRNGRIAGYLLAHQGHEAVQIGPWAADDEHTADMLLRAFLRRASGRAIFLDVPAPNQAAARMMDKYGFQVQRGFMRMYAGHNELPGRPSGIYGTSGAEKG